MDKEVLERIAILKEFYIDLFFAIAKPNLSKEEAVEKANILMAYLDGEILNSINNRYLPGEDLLERANPNAKQLIKLLTSKQMMDWLRTILHCQGIFYFQGCKKGRITMHLLAIVGSPRKNQKTDTLVDKAIEGFKSLNEDNTVKKIYLSDHNINYCKDCLVCWKEIKAEPYAKCVIRDDMDWIYEEIVKADRLIFGTPVHMGYATGMVMTFLERICWTFGRPEKNYLDVKGVRLRGRWLIEKQLL